MRLQAAILVLLLAPLLTACAFEPAGCPAALQPGTLAANVPDGTELVLKEDVTGFMRPIRWPSGFGVRSDGDVLVVTDVFGRVKAREGDRVALPGGEVSSDGPWGVCGDMNSLVQPPADLPLR